MRRLPILCALTLMVTLLAGAAPPPAAAYRPPPGPIFNKPDPWGSDRENHRIVRAVEQAIRKAQDGPNHHNPHILISTFLLDRKASVDALIDACRRGVSVRVVIDADIDNRNSRRLVSKLNGDNLVDRDGDGVIDAPRTGKCGRSKTSTSGRVVRGDDAGDAPLMSRSQANRSLYRPSGQKESWGRDGSYVKKCSGSCRRRGSGGNMHAKFYVFSRTGQTNNVVMVSSSNLNRGGARLGWNDLIIFRGKRKAVNFYTEIHRKMTEERPQRPLKKVQVGDGFVSRFYPMRDATKRTDPVMQDLNQIRCGPRSNPTRIHVSMFYWKGTRGNYLAGKLLNLARNGCVVKAIYGAPSRQMADRLRTAAGRLNNFHLWDSRWDCRGSDGWSEVRTHAKYVLVKGRYRNRTRAFQVWTGTPNWVRGSLTLSDENTVNVNSRGTYYRYLDNWHTIRKYSRRMPYSRYGKPGPNHPALQNCPNARENLGY